MIELVLGLINLLLLIWVLALAIRLDRSIDRCNRKLRGMLNLGELMSKELDDLTAQVAANTSLEASAVQMITGLAAQIAASASDPAKVTALSATLKTSADALAAAITANTPAATPAPAPAPSTLPAA